MVSPAGQQTLRQLREALEQYREHADAHIKVGELVRQFREATGLKPTQFARRLQVAPQTVSRWEKNEARPRWNQLRKFQDLIESNRDSGSTAAGGGADTADESVEAIGRLGIRFADDIMHRELGAKAVWVVKNGRLREADRGYMGELVLQALQAGTDFKYVFFQNTEAEESFHRQFKPWIKAESFRGSVTGYCIKNHRFAYEVGLSNAPTAWIAIEYGPEQAARLQRRFDVFVSLAIREYTGSSKTGVKNDDGQPCWLELATPRAGAWMSHVSRLRAKTLSDAEVEVIRLEGRKK